MLFYCHSCFNQEFNYSIEINTNEEIKMRKKQPYSFSLRIPPLAFSGGNGFVLDGHIWGSKIKELAFRCLLDMA